MGDSGEESEGTGSAVPVSGEIQHRFPDRHRIQPEVQAVRPLPVCFCRLNLPGQREILVASLERPWGRCEMRVALRASSTCKVGLSLGLAECAAFA